VQQPTDLLGLWFGPGVPSTACSLCDFLRRMLCVGHLDDSSRMCWHMTLHLAGVLHSW